MLKNCLYCNSEFNTIRSKAKYCCAAHRTAALRERRNNDHRQESIHSICQREGCDNPLSENTKSTTRYCSNSCRQKVYHQKEEVKKKAKVKHKKKIEIKKEREAQIEKAQAVEEFIQELMN